LGAAPLNAVGVQPQGEGGQADAEGDVDEDQSLAQFRHGFFPSGSAFSRPRMSRSSCSFSSLVRWYSCWERKILCSSSRWASRFFLCAARAVSVAARISWTSFCRLASRSSCRCFSVCCALSVTRRL